MNRILILFAHPNFERSRVQYRLLNAVKSLPHVTVHDLYEHYPDFLIDVAQEHSLLEDHDIILFQHPLYWYSVPPLIREWQDAVLSYGFAYGKDGTHLNGKYWGHVISAGGSRESYNGHGLHGCTLRELLKPLEQSAYLCGMTFLPPFAIHGTHDMNEQTIDKHATHYREILQSMHASLPKAQTLKSLTYLNDAQTHME